MLRSHFIISALLLLGSFLVPGLKATACEMHKKAKTSTASTTQKKEAAPQSDCCNRHGSNHQKSGHCTHDNCTNNSCHPASVYSLHVVNPIEITPISPESARDFIRKNDRLLSAHAYAIWQPPRMS